MLTDRQDAYGHEVFDYLEGRGGFEVIERDDGYVDISSGPPAYFAEYEQWPAHQQEGMQYVRGQVLDIGCGAGRVALYLQRKGYEVTGVDISPLAIEVCRRRGLRQAEVLPITRLSARFGMFDTLIMYGNNFGLLGGWQRGRWLLRRFWHMTTSQARLIVESADPYQTQEPLHLAYHNFNRRRGRMGGQLRLRVRYKIYASPWFDYLLASRDEMEALLKGTGWAVTRTIDSQGPAYVALIEKTTR